MTSRTQRILLLLILITKRIKKELIIFIKQNKKMNTLLTQLQSSRVNLETNKNNRSKTNDTSHNPRDLAGLELGRLPLLPKILAVVRKINKKELTAYIQTTQ